MVRGIPAVTPTNIQMRVLDGIMGAFSWIRGFRMQVQSRSGVGVGRDEYGSVLTEDGFIDSRFGIYQRQALHVIQYHMNGIQWYVPTFVPTFLFVTISLRQQ